MPRQPRGVVSRDSSLAKTRRSHRKSRNGCSECKRRHIRCDEGRPACTNCAIAERACSYPPTATLAAAATAVSASASASASTPTSPAQAQAKAQTQAPAPAPSPSPAPVVFDYRHRDQPRHHNLRSHPTGTRTPSPAHDRAASAASGPARHDHASAAGTPSEHPSEPSHLVTDASLPPPPPPSLVGGAYLYTPQHLMLLLHVKTDVAKTIAILPGQGDLLISIALRYTIDSPYLMDELLAISATHLALTRSQPSFPSPVTSAEAASYRHQATELQTRALASFTRETESLVATGDDKSTTPTASPIAIARFLFSAMLGIHVLADCLARDPVADFHAFIDGFVDCILLHHGVRIVIRPNWPAFINSELRELLHPGLLKSEGDLRGQTGEAASGGECAPLERLLQSSDLSAASIEACRGAVSTLQASFNMQSALGDPLAPNSCSAFAVTVSVEFVNVLRKHRPEAIIILAYYGVLLHRSRACWIFANSGARLIRAISHHLGGFWQDALRWPLEVIETEVDN